MITTRPHSETIIARIKREPKFARALYAEAVNCFLEGETAVGLSMLRDIVNAQISFKELARQTGLGEKSLHRMLVATAIPRPDSWPPTATGLHRQSMYLYYWLCSTIYGSKWRIPAGGRRVRYAWRPAATRSGGSK
ncbi:MAG: DNA-binding protein, partial [Limisphaerales bacterium]